VNRQSPTSAPPRQPMVGAMCFSIEADIVTGVVVSGARLHSAGSLTGTPLPRFTGDLRIV
jgi:hypothetical protein